MGNTKRNGSGAAVVKGVEDCTGSWETCVPKLSTEVGLAVAGIVAEYWGENVKVGLKGREVGVEWPAWQAASREKRMTANNGILACFSQPEGL